MRTRDRVIGLTAIGLGLGFGLGFGFGLAPAFGFDGAHPVPPAAIMGATPAPPPAINPRRDPVIPRPPAPIPMPAARLGPVPAPPPAVGAMPVPPPPPVAGAMPVPPLAKPAPPPTAWEAFRHGMLAERAGEKTKAVTALEYAAEQGFPAAQWKLGRMYADGDGVKQSDLRAFEYFSRIADTHAEDNPRTPQARFVASAFVALGHYYLEGIPDTAIKRDVGRARRMYAYAASYFGDPDGQYHLARLYLDGTGMPKDARLARQWLFSAARKGQHQAQAVLGHMLFKGEQVPRQAAHGLMWLTLARDAAGPTEGWISEMYDVAFKQATADERALAGEYLMRWMNDRRN